MPDRLLRILLAQFPLEQCAQNWLEYLAELYNETFVSCASATGRLTDAYAALDQAVIGHAGKTRSGDIDVSALTAAQRLTAAECLRAIAERARDVMRRLLIYDAGNEFILSTPSTSWIRRKRGNGIRKSTGTGCWPTRQPILPLAESSPAYS